MRWLLLFLAATAFAADPFFNGKDLTGWSGTDPDYWSVEEGAIIGHSTERVPHNTFLWSKVPVSNFYFSVDVKLTPNARNAGIQFRSRPHGKSEALGYQADIGNNVWGRLYHESGRGKLDWRDRGEKAVKPDAWNHYEILAVGDRVWTAINGTLSVSVRDPKGEAAGQISLQIHSGAAQTVRYRINKLVHNPPVALAGLNEAQLDAELIPPLDVKASVPAPRSGTKARSGTIKPRGEVASAEAPVPVWSERIAAIDPGSQKLRWAKPGFDHSAWKTMPVPGHFEKHGLPDFDGVVWFRRVIQIPKDWTPRKSTPATLHLGQIDDMDVTWVNGRRVGGFETPGHHFTDRVYPVPAGVLKPGANTIAVRVMDHGWGGGLAGDAKNFKLVAGDSNLPLNGAWYFAAGATKAQLMAPPAASETPAAGLPNATLSTDPYGTDGFELRNGEVVAIAGGGTIGRQMELGFLEAHLTTAQPFPIHVRDISWQADTVYQMQRPRNFGSQLEQLQRIHATVLVCQFGQMEVLDSRPVAEFIAHYRTLLDELAPQTRRVVLIGPQRFAEPPTPYLPDLTKHNERVDTFSRAVSELAKERDALFIDLSELDPDTSDGLQLTDPGHEQLAAVIAHQLMGKVEFTSDDKLLGLIQRKNQLWRQHARPTNWAFVYGNRQHVASSKDHRPGQPRWFPKELDGIIKLIETAESEILKEVAR